MRTLLRAIVALLLLPACVGASWGVLHALSKLKLANQQQTLFLAGLGGYFACHVLLPIPKRVYVFAHELTHAVTLWLSGGQVKSFKVASSSGAVAGTRSGALVSLSPYLVPVYTLLIGIGYFLASLFSAKPPQSAWFLFAVGASLAFHLAFTADTLRTRQPDLAALGYPLSLVLIYLANLFVVAFVFFLAFRDLSFLALLRDAGERSWLIYQGLWKQLSSIKV